MSVSKIIPTIGKRPECVMETIESLIAQTVNPVEISIVMSGFSEHEVTIHQDPARQRTKIGNLHCSTLRDIWATESPLISLNCRTIIQQHA